MNYKKKTPLFKQILAAATLTLALGIVAILDPNSFTDEPASYQPVSYHAAAQEKEYTLMVYMVGSDLESAARAASDNLAELQKVSTDNINIVVETGGSYKWHTDGLQAQYNTRLHIENEKIIIDEKLPSRNMGAADTLTDFIAYARATYPSDKLILALWNHGDGPTGGFGYDELYAGDSLHLDELNLALKAAQCDKKPIDIIGFDACCMASIEVALSVQPYASYMIASQEIEPAGGWDYTVMDTLSGMSPLVAACKIANAYFDKAQQIYSGATVSVTNLAEILPLKSSIEGMVAAIDKIGYAEFSKLRGTMRGFGGAGRSTGKSDLVDLHSFFDTLGSADIDISATTGQLSKAVILAKSGDTKSAGLSIYAPYSELFSFAAQKLQSYNNTNTLPHYAKLSLGFANYILSKQLVAMQPSEAMFDGDSISAAVRRDNIKSAYMTTWEKDERQQDYYYMTGTDSSVTYENGEYIYDVDEEWTFLGGRPLCTLELEGAKGIYTRFACPVMINDVRANLILQYDRENAYGKVLYAIPLGDDEHLSKIIKPLFGGEEITPIYPVEAFGDGENASAPEYISAIKGYKIGDSFVYDTAMQLEALPAHENALYGFWFTTFQNKDFYSDFYEAA